MHIHRRNLEAKRIQEQERQRGAESSLGTAGLETAGLETAAVSSIPMEA